MVLNDQLDLSTPHSLNRWTGHYSFLNPPSPSLNSILELTMGNTHYPAIVLRKVTLSLICWKPWSGRLKFVLKSLYFLFINIEFHQVLTVFTVNNVIIFFLNVYVKQILLTFLPKGGKKVGLFIYDDWDNIY